MLIDISPLRKHRDYRLLYIGQFVSTFGSMITYVAVPIQVFELTHSSLIVGMLGAAQLIPLLVFALWGGAYADVIDRRRLLIISEILLTAGSLALVINSLLPSPSVAAIFLIGAAMSGVNGFHRPALDAMTPRLVEREDLTAVSALNTLRFSSSAIAGPALGAICIGAFGFAATYAIDVLSFLVSLVAVASIRAMPAAEGAAAASVNSILDGLKYARSRPELIGTYVVDMVAMTFAFPIALFPAMAADWGEASGAGYLFSAMSVGSLLISLFSGWTNRIHRHGAAVVVSAALGGVAIAALGFATSMTGAMIWLAAAGAADTVSGLFRSTMWNETIPSDLRGRLAGVEMISYLSGPLLGNARAGWVASMTSNAVSVVSGGAICVTGVLLCIWALPAFWSYRKGA